uniref:Uncharacterized protein n=1 Tax=Arundo donax TaxID=35708 RepID=A0A0A9DZ31_ARUDO
MDSKINKTENISSVKLIKTTIISEHDTSTHSAFSREHKKVKR